MIQRQEAPTARFVHVRVLGRSAGVFSGRRQGGLSHYNVPSQLTDAANPGRLDAVYSGGRSETGA